MIKIDNITYVTSDINRATKKNLIAFHKCLKCVFNAEVLDDVYLSTELYASFIVSPCELTIHFAHEKYSNEWYKVCNPKFSKHNKYLSIRTSDLVFNQKYVFRGAFDYKTYQMSDGLPVIVIPIPTLI